MAADSSPRRKRVLFLPGFGAGDGSMLWLRTAIAAQGHDVHRWKAGRNNGPTPQITASLVSRLRELVDRHQTKIALVGWSLGGAYAWALASSYPGMVQQVITLGSPLRNGSGGLEEISVPATSIWTRRDRIVPWEASVVRGHRAENIEVRSTHLTLGFDPFVAHAVADRLRQQPERWETFRPPPWLRHGYATRQATP